MSFIWLKTGLRMNNIERKFLKYLIPPLLSLIHFWHKSSRELFIVFLFIQEKFCCREVVDEIVI